MPWSTTYLSAIKVPSFCCALHFPTPLIITLWYKRSASSFCLNMQAPNPHEMHWDGLLLIKCGNWYLTCIVEGIRHTHVTPFILHIRHYEGRGQMHVMQQLLLDHPLFWDHDEITSRFGNLLRIARHRQECARRAARTIMCIQSVRPQLLSKDMARQVARAVLERRLDDKWSEPRVRLVDYPFVARIRNSIARASWQSNLAVFFTIIYLIIVIWIIWAIPLMYGSPPWVPQECVGVQCRGDPGLPGPSAPPGAYISPNLRVDHITIDNTQPTGTSQSKQ